MDGATATPARPTRATVVARLVALRAEIDNLTQINYALWRSDLQPPHPPHPNCCLHPAVPVA